MKSQGKLIAESSASSFTTRIAAASGQYKATLLPAVLSKCGGHGLAACAFNHQIYWAKQRFKGFTTFKHWRFGWIVRVVGDLHDLRLHFSDTDFSGRLSKDQNFLSTNPVYKSAIGLFRIDFKQTHTIHGTGRFTYIWLMFYGKCREIHHTWMLWDTKSQWSFCVFSFCLFFGHPSVLGGPKLSHIATQILQDQPKGLYTQYNRTPYWRWDEFIASLAPKASYEIWLIWCDVEK